MKKKVLAIIAAGTTALGTAIIATPAHAVQYDVTVQVKVDPVIYLRTFKSVNLVVSQGDLGGVTGDQNDQVTDGNKPISKLRPTFTKGTKTTIDKKIQELFAVWGNSDSDVKITVTASQNKLTETVSERTAMMTVNNNTLPSGKPDTIEPLVGGVDLTFDFGTRGPVAGTYTGGVLTIDATSP